VNPASVGTVGAAVVAVVVAATALHPRPRRPVRDDTTPRSFGASRLHPTIETMARSWRRRRMLRRPPTPRLVAEWCDDIARQVRSGASLRDALVSATSADAGIERVVDTLRLAIDRGASVTDAVGRVDSGGPHVQLALSVIGTASRVGGPSAAAIDRTAMSLRRRAAEIDDRSTHAAQARLSTHVMTALPLLMLTTLTVTDDGVRAVTVSPIGAACIGAGLALNLLGWLWMRRIMEAAR